MPDAHNFLIHIQEESPALVVALRTGDRSVPQHLLQQENLEIHFAANMPKPCTLPRTGRSNLILTGERTPGKEDIELLRRLRMVRPHTRLIILTEEFIPAMCWRDSRARVHLFFAAFSTDGLER